MLYKVFDADELPLLVQAFMNSFEVVAPVKCGDHYSFEPISSNSEIALDYDTTLVSPKNYFLPNTEPLMSFDREENRLTSFKQDVTPRVIFGMHACDINALCRLDLVFRDSKFPDPYYCARRDATLIVGVSCKPNSNCFCNVLDANEASFGYDLFLYNLGNKFLVSISSVKAANILEAAVNLRDATDADRIEYGQVTRKNQSAFNKDIPHIHDLPMLMDAFHSDVFWDKLGSKCLSCCACAAVCPTCFCFDIKDVLSPGGRAGQRVRESDACTSPTFATVAGGHNFRQKPQTRVRHRMYHKLNGFFTNHNRMLCVGCGRCVRACKANISPIEVLKFFDKKGA